MYRAAVVACDLEGLGRSAAAVQLGWSEGTLSSRLARARVLLARRLSRYGLVVPVAGLGTAAAPAVVAAELAEPTVRLGLLLAAGEAVVAAPVATLMEVAMGTMLQTKLKSLAAALAVGCALAVTAAGWRADAAGPGDQPQPAEAPKREARNPDKERIAELERERDLLLKKVADLRARLAVVESALESSAQKEAAAKRAAAEALARAEADLARAEKAASSGSEKEPEIDGKKQSEWIVLLHGEDVAQRQAAVLALAKFGPKAAPDLAAALTDKDLVNVRLWAAHALGQMGPKAKATAPQLAAALKDENGLVRVEAAKALWKVAEDKAAVTALAKTLTDTDATTRYRAAEALGEIGPAAKAAAPALVSALKDDGFAVFGPGPGVVERRPVSKAAAKALKRVDPAAAKEHGIE
jgi:HEAT repeat protein